MRAAMLCRVTRLLHRGFRPAGFISLPAPQRIRVAEQQRHAAAAALQDIIPLTSTPLPKTSKQQQQPDPAEDGASGWQAPPVQLWCQNDLLMSGCEPGKKLRVAVLLSGGVDSSLALRLLLAAGHECTAFYLQIWFQEDFRNFWDSCPWEEDLGYARKVCESLGVELQVVPMTTQYWDRVVSHSVNEIREGRTPNPDMLCNSCVKFGAFYDYLDREHPGRYDRIASGHYARVVIDGPAGSSASLSDGSNSASSSLSPKDAGGRHQGVDSHEHPGAGCASAGGDAGGQPRESSTPCSTQAEPGPISAALARGSYEPTSRSGGSAPVGRRSRLALTPDPVKDQTYFLAHLSPEQLSRAMFPLGTLTKRQVRQLAAVAQLANMDRKDSQGICFLGKVKFNEFVKEHLGEWPGLLVEVETGGVVGLHLGYWFYTVGQRSGIKLPGGPWYVVQKDRQLNVVYVSRGYYSDDKSRNTFATGPINWVSQARPDHAHPVHCKVRHGPAMYKCEEFELHPVGAAASWHQQRHLASLEQHPPNLVDGAGSARVLSEGLMTEQQAARVRLEGNDQGLAAGQYAVFYQHGICLGAAMLM